MRSMKTKRELFCFIIICCIPFISIKGQSNNQENNAAILSKAFPFHELSHVKTDHIPTHRPISPILNKPSTAFFCRIEREIDKKVSVPIRMRVGDLDYVNRLEHK